MTTNSALRVRVLLCSVALGGSVALLSGCDGMEPVSMKQDPPVMLTTSPAPVYSAEQIDTSVCYPDPDTGEWLSDYSVSGYCTFGLPLDTLPEDEPEDSPRFDCRVHGNRICGPGAVLPE